MTQLPLQDKTCLITGSSRGVGKAIAKKLASQGANIIVNYVMNEEAANGTVSELKELGSQAIAIQANMRENGDIKELVKKSLDEFASIDVLIHNAAMGSFKPLHKLKPNHWDLTMDINAKAFLFLTEEVLPSMEKNGSGKIIAISSLGAQRFLPDYGAIGISKAALENLVRYLGAELAPKGIHVNAVSGGPIDTDALKMFTQFQEHKEDVINKTPLKRLGNPEDLANVVSFLVSPEAHWIVGQTIIADGGLSLS